MLAIREIVNRDIFQGYDIPKEFGENFEMILVPLDENIQNEQFLAATYNNTIEENSTEDKIWMKYQEENGFSKNILAQESEDVWNDI
jgi:hypothetical protein